MPNNEYVQEWFAFADMDFQAAKHLDASMHPKPLEIICYHCEQAAEKMLKGVLLSYDASLKKTHDLGLLIEELASYVTVEERFYEICSDLTPYGVAVRYPQEVYIEERHVRKALADTADLLTWLQSLSSNRDYC